MDDCYQKYLHFIYDFFYSCLYFVSDEDELRDDGVIHNLVSDAIEVGQIVGQFRLRITTLWMTMVSVC